MIIENKTLYCKIRYSVFNLKWIFHFLPAADSSCSGKRSDSSARLLVIPGNLNTDSVSIILLKRDSHFTHYLQESSDINLMDSHGTTALEVVFSPFS